MGKRSRKKKTRRNPAADLTDDLIVEILSRLPVKSVCRFKCVSKHWLNLISHPDHRRRLPQTLAGFFHYSRDYTRFPEEARHFTSVCKTTHPPLVRPSLSFLPGYEMVTRVLDSCNGLLLCHLRVDSQPLSSQDASFRYVVCNPATQSWVVLPDSGCGSESRLTRLGFAPAVSLHFCVFEFINNDHEVVEGVQIYSCRTGAWNYKESEWDYDLPSFDDDTKSVFLNGLLHLVIVQTVVAVDVEGETWIMFSVPDDEVDIFEWEPGFVGRYQGQLCYINECDCENDLSLWILKDYTTGEWLLKHEVSIEHLCEKMMSPPQSNFYHVITLHPNSNLILYTAGLESTLMAYDIDREEAWVIKSLGSQSRPPYVPYIPFYSESLTEGHS